MSHLCVFRDTLCAMSYDSRFLGQLAMQLGDSIETPWRSKDPSGSSLDTILKIRGYYDAHFDLLINAIASTSLMTSAPLVKAAINLFLSSGYAKKDLPARFQCVVPDDYLAIISEDDSMDCPLPKGRMERSVGDVFSAYVRAMGHFSGIDDTVIDMVATHYNLTIRAPHATGDALVAALENARGFGYEMVSGYFIHFQHLLEDSPHFSEAMGRDFDDFATKLVNYECFL